VKGGEIGVRLYTPLEAPQCAIVASVDYRLAPEFSDVGLGAHHWARQFTALGHEVRLIPPAYVKPFVKLQIRDLGEATQRMAGFLHSYTRRRHLRQEE